jgi:hypothetical protein
MMRRSIFGDDTAYGPQTLEEAAANAPASGVMYPGDANVYDGPLPQAVAAAAAPSTGVVYTPTGERAAPLPSQRPSAPMQQPQQQPQPRPSAPLSRAVPRAQQPQSTPWWQWAILGVGAISVVGVVVSMASGGKKSRRYGR